MVRLPIALLAGLALALFTGRALAEGRRVALVVGVGAYQNVARLPNATNDASAVAEMFKKAGFEVVTARTDVGNLEFKRSIREFEDQVGDADIGVVFYAGHAIEIQGVNYLIPTDAKLANERDAEDEAITLERVTNALDGAKRLRLVILDACRDNPFTNKMKRRVASRGVSVGLARVEPQGTETLIAYATRATSTAADGDGEHSPFTTALLNNLSIPGLDVRLAFGRIRDEVMRATNGKQEPYVYGSLGGREVSLVPGRVEVASIAQNDAVTQKSDYELIERVGKREAWQVFLNTHKSGMYVELARIQLAKLDGPDGIARTAIPGAPLDALPNASPKIEAPIVAPAPRASAEEQRTWDRLKGSTDRVAIRKFLERYPTSPLAPLAQDRLDLVDRIAREREEAVRAEREVARQRDDDERRAKAAEVERQRLDREAKAQRETETKARAAETERQRAEAAAALRQRESEDKLRAAEALARQRETDDRARAAAQAEIQRQADERARSAEAERQRRDQEAVARRGAEERAKAAAKDGSGSSESSKAAEADRQRADRDAVAAREAEDRARAAAVDQQRREQEAAVRRREQEAKAKASAEAERRRAAEAAEATREAAREAAARRRDREAAEERREATEARRRAIVEEAAANRRRATERAASAEADRKRRVAREAQALRARPAPQAARAQPAPRAQASAPAPAARSGGASFNGIGF